MLEGPRREVTATFGRILRDPRHREVSLIWCGDTPERIFADSTMRDEPVLSWMWTPEELGMRGVASLPAGEVRQVFVRLAKQPHIGWAVATG
jgi:hypothetical protein